MAPSRGLKERDTPALASRVTPDHSPPALASPERSPLASPERHPLDPPSHGAILDPSAAAAAFSIARYAPSPALAPFVRRFWFIRWNRSGQAPHPQGTLTLPAVNTVVEIDQDSVSGVWTRRFDRTLEGEGAVFGCLFRPAGFRPFWGRSMHLLTDRALPFREVFGVPAGAIRALAFAGAPDGDIVAAYERFLLDRDPQLSAEVAEVNRWVELVESEPAIARAEALAARLGVGLRTLQRGMRDGVGVGPKQVIRRYRLLEAAGRLGRGESVDQVELALALGYADQSHFVRDFRDVVGRPPARYATEQAAGR
jgi:AraC-like DNA-binding protein